VSTPSCFNIKAIISPPVAVVDIDHPLTYGQ
jgi:hypothetical protein